MALAVGQGEGKAFAFILAASAYDSIHSDTWTRRVCSYEVCTVQGMRVPPADYVTTRRFPSRFGKQGRKGVILSIHIRLRNIGEA